MSTITIREVNEQARSVSHRFATSLAWLLAGLAFCVLVVPAVLIVYFFLVALR